MKVGIDLGYGFTKIVAQENGEINHYKLPSVVGEYRDLDYKMDIAKDEDDLSNIVVNVDGEKYFVGDIANRQSDIVYFSLNEDKFDERSTMIMMKAGLALATLGSESSSSSVNVVTGLPVAFYSKHKDKVTSKMKDNHGLSISKDAADTFQTKNIDVQNVRVVPQPFGTMFNEILDENGELVNEELAKKDIGIVDIGFKTSDITVARSLEYIDNQSMSTTTSMSTAFKIIQDKLMEEFGVTKPIYKLDEIVRKGSINIKGKSYNIENIKDYAYRVVAEKIVGEVTNLWTNIWERDQIILTGGGGHQLGEYIKKRLDNCELAETPQEANTFGYLKLAKRLW